MDDANAFLPTFLADYNRRFAVASRVAEDAHRTLAHRPCELDLLLAEHRERVVSKSLSLQYRNVLYQIHPDGPGYRVRGAKVNVCERPAGEVVLLYDGRELPYTTYRKGERPPPPADDKSVNGRVDAALAKQGRQTAATPRADHPWPLPLAPWRAGRRPPRVTLSAKP